jgi:hypothetical protein
MNKQHSAQVIDIASATAAANPEKLPTFPTLATAIDGYMQRVPWWAIAIGSIFAYRYVMTRKKG